MNETPLVSQPVFMCSGQGAQKPGMGADLHGIPEVDEVFAIASDVFGRDMRAACEAMPADELNDTRNAQAATSTLSLAIGRALMARGIVPSAVLGFSLGQVTALALSGMVSDRTMFQIVRARASIMGDAAQARPGVMSALLKASEEDVNALCAQCAQGDVLVPANYNCPGQIVVAGTPEAMARAEAAWAEQGRKFVRLATSGAFHCPLMDDAARQFAQFLAEIDFDEPKIALICNVDARPLDAKGARQHLVDHLTHPVLFEQSVGALVQSGHRSFVEIGYGGVLANLIKRIDRSLERACVQDRQSFDDLVSMKGLV